MSGSHGFNAVSRSSLIVAHHPDGPEEQRVVAWGKSNYVKRPPSYEFTIETRKFAVGDQLIRTSMATDFKLSTLTDDDLLAVRKPENKSKAETARQYIRSVLSDGQSHEAKPIIDHLMHELGLSDDRLIRKAREDIGAVSERKPEYQGGVRWRLPGENWISPFIRNDRNGTNPTPRQGG